MPKGRRKIAPAAKAKKQAAIRLQATYFRLCHLCLHLNESGREIVRCERCQHSLATDPVMRYLETHGDVGSEDDDDVEMEITAHEDFVAPGRDDDEAIAEAQPMLTGLKVLW